MKKYLVIIISKKYRHKFECLMNNIFYIEFEHLYGDQFIIFTDEKKYEKLKKFEWIAIIKMES